MLFEDQETDKKAHFLIPGMSVVHCKYRVMNEIYLGARSNMYSIVVEKA